MRRSKRSNKKKRFDYGDMYTKPQGIDTNPLTQMNVGTPAGLQQGASPYYTPQNLNTIAKPPEPRMTDTQKGSLIGTAGQLVGSAIESKQKMQDTEFTRDLQSSRKEAKAALYGIGTAAAAVNPIVGGAIIAGTAIGSAVGSQTQDEWGGYKSRAGNALDEMVNPVTGYQGIKRAIKGRQTTSGVVNKLTLGLFGKSDNQKDAEKGKREWEAKRIRSIKDKSQQKLANYPTSGVSDYNTMLAMGGFLPKYTKRGKRRYQYGGGLTGKPEPRTSTDPLEEEEGDPNQAASPYYSPENLNALTAALKPQPQANPPPSQQPPKGSFFSSPKGQATGAALNVAADFIPKNDKYAETQSATEKKTDEAGVQIAGAIGPWWGALAKVGTTASGHIRKDDNVSHAQGFLGDTVNPFHQFTSFQEGRGKEKTAAFLNPVMASHLAADRRKRIAVNKKREEEAELKRNSQYMLGKYNTAGNQYYAKYGMKFPAGGNLPYPTDGSEVNQLSSNMAQYEGSTHANGGIELDTDQDQQPDIEVEGTEVIKDNMVFSNRLRPSKDVKTIVRDSGVGTKKGDTYATLSARIGKKKGKFEEQIKSTRPGEKNSAQLMQARLDETANLLFMDQQVRKFKKGTNGKFPNGGKFPDPKKKKIDPYDTRLENLVSKEDLKKAANTPMSPLNRYDSASRGLAPVLRVSKVKPSAEDYEFLKNDRFNVYEAPPSQSKILHAGYLPANIYQKFGGKFPNGGNIPPKRKGTGFIAPLANKDAFKRDALGKNRAELEKDKSLQTLDIGRVDFEDWNQRGADNPDNPLNDPRLLSVDRKQILDRFKTDNKLFATTFARFDPGNSPEQQKLKGSWMDNDIYMDAVPQPLPETTSTPTSTKKLKPTYVAPQLYQYGSWKKPKKPYGGYTGDPIPRRRGRTVQATNVTPPPVFPPAVNPLAPNAPIIPANPNAPIAPYSTPNFEGQPPPRFNIEDETRRLDALGKTPTYPKGGKFSVPTSGRGASAHVDLNEYPSASYPYNISQVNTPLYTSVPVDAWANPVEQASKLHKNFMTASDVRYENKFYGQNNPRLQEAAVKADSAERANIVRQKYIKEMEPTNKATREAWKRVYGYSKAYGGYTGRLHKMNDALKTRAFGGYLPAFGEGDAYDRKSRFRDTAIADQWITNPFTGGSSRMTYTPKLTDPPVYASNTTIAPTPRKFGVSDYKGDIAAGIGTIANQIQIGKLETEFNPELADTPRNPYTDRRDYLKQQAGEQYTTATQGIAGSSNAQDNLALKSNMYAKSLSGLNQQLDQEQQREDAYATKHAELKNRTNLINTQTKNAAKQLSMENRNQKKALTQANIDNLIRSYQGNEQVRQFAKTDYARNQLINARAGERGVDARTIAELPPEVRKQLGYEAEGGIFKKGGIYIKPKNRGKFNALKKRTGKTTAELKHSKNPLTRKRATFAANAKKWKHKGRKKS